MKKSKDHVCWDSPVNFVVIWYWLGAVGLFSPSQQGEAARKVYHNSMLRCLVLDTILLPGAVAVATVAVSICTEITCNGFINGGDWYWFRVVFGIPCAIACGWQLALGKLCGNDFGLTQDRSLMCICSTQFKRNDNNQDPSAHSEQSAQKSAKSLKTQNSLAKIMFDYG